MNPSGTYQFQHGMIPVCSLYRPFPLVPMLLGTVPQRAATNHQLAFRIQTRGFHHCAVCGSCLSIRQGWRSTLSCGIRRQEKICRENGATTYSAMAKRLQTPLDTPQTMHNSLLTHANASLSKWIIPRAFNPYSVIRFGIQRRFCTRARFQSCLLSSLHSSNQRLWGLGGYLPRSTCA